MTDPAITCISAGDPDTVRRRLVERWKAKIVGSIDRDAARKAREADDIRRQIADRMRENARRAEEIAGRLHPARHVTSVDEGWGG